MEEAPETGNEGQESKDRREGGEGRASDLTLDLNKDPENKGSEPGAPSTPDEGGGSSSPEIPPVEGGQEPPKTPDKATQELEKKNKELFARAKKAEKKLKDLEGKKAGDKEEGQFASADPIALAKTVAALKDFSSDELDYVKLIANGKGIPLEEAVETDEVKTYIGAKREKAEGDNKTPGPSSPSSVIGGKTGEDIEKMDTKKFTKFFKDKVRGRKTGV